MMAELVNLEIMLEQTSERQKIQLDEIVKEEIMKENMAGFNLQHREEKENGLEMRTVTTLEKIPRAGSQIMKR